MRRIAWAGMVLVSVVSLCTGCDFIRASLGKPTSADLAALREEKAAREQAERDSVAAAVEQEVLQTVVSVLETETAPKPESKTSNASLKRYYAVAGAFKNPSGAQAYIDKLEEKGCQVRTFDFKSGLTVVCLEGSDSLEDARRDIETLRQLHLAPTDPWIYNTTKKLHKE